MWKVEPNPAMFVRAPALPFPARWILPLAIGLLSVACGDDAITEPDDDAVDESLLPERIRLGFWAQLLAEADDTDAAGQLTVVMYGRMGPIQTFFELDEDTPFFPESGTYLAVESTDEDVAVWEPTLPGSFAGSVHAVSHGSTTFVFHYMKGEVGEGKVLWSSAEIPVTVLGDAVARVIPVDLSAMSPHQPPIGWREVWSPGYWVMVDYHGFRALRSSAASSGNQGLVSDQAGNTVNAEVLARVLSSDFGPSSRNRLILRASGGPDSQIGYALDLREEGLRFTRFLDGRRETVGSIQPFSWEANRWYWLRFRVHGNELSMKGWPDGDPEPDDWLYSAHDGYIQQAARVGLAVYQSGNRDFSHIVIATGGASAPSPEQPTEVGQLLIKTGSEPAAAASDTSVSGRIPDVSMGQLSIELEALGANGLQYRTDNGAGFQVIFADQDIAQYEADDPSGQTGRIMGVNSAGGTTTMTLRYLRNGVTEFETAPIPVVVEPFVVDHELSLAEDFSGHILGEPPVGWTPVWATEGADWRVRDDFDGRPALVDDPQAGRGLRAIVMDHAGHILNPDVVTLIKIVAYEDMTQQGIAIRVNRDVLGEGYLCQVRPTGLRIRRSTPAGNPGFSTMDWELGEWYFLRFQAAGNTLRCKAWKEGQEEPAEWTVEAVDNAIVQPGEVGLYRWGDDGNGAPFDFIGIGAGGREPPRP